MPDTIERLEYVNAGELAWREAPAPVLESDAQALVRPVAVATCDLDALIVAGQTPFAPPFPIGHECVAEVVDVGDGVSGVTPGQLVTVPFQISCGTCAACRRGHTGNCQTVGFMSTYGFGPAVDTYGGFLADSVLVPYADHMLVPLPEDVDPVGLASASDNISDGWRAVGPALEESPGASVLVLGGAGPGSIGLYATGIAVALGASEVVYVDDHEERCRVASELGAQVISEDRPRRLGPFPITVDASGADDALALALRSTALDGVCTSTAIYFGEVPELPLLEMYTKVTTLKIGRVHARAVIPQVVDLIASGRLDPSLVTSSVADWSSAAPALLELDWTKLVISRPRAS